MKGIEILNEKRTDLETLAKAVKAKIGGVKNASTKVDELLAKIKKNNPIDAKKAEEIVSKAEKSNKPISVSTDAVDKLIAGKQKQLSKPTKSSTNTVVKVNTSKIEKGLDDVPVDSDEELGGEPKELDPKEVKKHTKFMLRYFKRHGNDFTDMDEIVKWLNNDEVKEKFQIDDEVIKYASSSLNISSDDEASDLDRLKKWIDDNADKADKMIKSGQKIFKQLN